jgi:acetyl/propionyl-CoA carboxylase alpha subunit
LLVANRGEIAVRILRSARSAGLRTVAVYSDADRTAPHVREADTAVRLGPAPAAQSYLSIDAVLAAARLSGAEAVHPGYGFLSERADFARAVADAGLVFVGPSAEAMAAMGRKDHARVIAERAGVPVVPRFGTGEPRAEPIGAGDPSAKGELALAYPVLVKAAAGGGGKGMRIVRRPADLAAAMEGARREARSAFGDDTLLVERYVERGRHVEVQVIGDAHGSVVHLFERDCSVQRRHQKVLEESPAPTISAAVRDRLTGAAVSLAREVGYVNAGTVEFLVAGEDVYFLEMNTRLQVEHPVTEMVTGLDLVQLQLLVAAGEPLPFTQDDVTIDGHAIEARVYAEDPYAGFLPQAGRAEVVRWPDPVRARVDHALASGQDVSTAYDPMLGKVIAHGPTREAARRALVTALDQTAIIGLRTNVGFLRSLVASEAYARAAIHTAWLDSDPAGAAAYDLPEIPGTLQPVAAWVLAGAADRVDEAGSGSPFAAGDGWRLTGPPAAIPVQLWYEGVTTTWQVNPVSGVVTGEGGEHRIGLVDRAGHELRLEVDGAVVDTTVAVDAHQVTVVLQGQPWVLERPDAFGSSSGSVVTDGDVAAPMPGTVLTVEVAVGDRVKTGDRLGVLEAMKMELSLTAPLDGIVVHAVAGAGAQVALGDVLFRVEPEPSSSPEESP